MNAAAVGPAGRVPAIGCDDGGQGPLPWLAAPLARAQALQRANALLVHGPAGAGHLELAGMLAQGWLCERPQPGGLPCGRCESCRLVHGRVHPDLRLVLTEQQRVAWGWPLEEEGRWLKADTKPGRELKVDQVRDAIAWGQQTSGRGRGKVLVLHPADLLNTASANALLKTLEEPPGALRIVLTTDDADRLLPTVRSRCQRLPLPLPATDEAVAWLRGQGLAQPEALLRLAGGSPLEALAWAQEGLDGAWLAEWPRRLASGDPSPLAGRPVPRVLALMLALVHDLMAVAVGAAPRFFSAAALPRGASLPALVDWQRALARRARHADHPWNAGLLIESLVAQGAAAWPRPAGAAAGGGTSGAGGRASLHSGR